MVILTCNQRIADITVNLQHSIGIVRGNHHGISCHTVVDGTGQTDTLHNAHGFIVPLVKVYRHALFDIAHVALIHRCIDNYGRHIGNGHGGTSGRYIGTGRQIQSHHFSVNGGKRVALCQIFQRVIHLFPGFVHILQAVFHHLLCIGHALFGIRHTSLGSLNTSLCVCNTSAAFLYSTFSTGNFLACVLHTSFGFGHSLFRILYASFGIGYRLFRVLHVPETVFHHFFRRFNFIGQIPIVQPRKNLPRLNRKIIHHVRKKQIAADSSFNLLCAGIFQLSEFIVGISGFTGGEDNGFCLCTGG